MRGGSHGDWNRFLCSQILGAERDTMLLTSRQPSVSSSNPTKTTPGEVLPGGVAVAVAASPGTFWRGSPGCARRAGARGPLPAQATTGVRAQGAGDALEAWRGVSKGPYWRGRPGGRRRVRDPWGSALRNAVRPGETPRWGPRKVSPFPTPDRRRHVPENRDRGIALPPPPGDYWHRSTPGGRLHGRSRAGRAPTSTEGPEAQRRSKPSGMRRQGPEIHWPKGAPLSPSRRIQRSQRGRRTGSGGGRKAGGGRVLASASCRYSTVSEPMPAVGSWGWTPGVDHLPYVYLGNHLARCCYVSICSPACPSSTWLNAFMAEVGPVNSTQIFQKFGAISSKFREVACLLLMHGPSPECPLLAKSNQDHFGGSW